MLGKLLKYEVKATARLFLPLYLTILVFAAISRFFVAAPGPMSINSFAMAIGMFIYVTLMVGLVVMTLIVMIQRFYRNLLGDEGYLMFTLPVKSWSHIVSKLTISMLWTILSAIVALFSVMFIASKNVSVPEIFKQMGIGYSIFRQSSGALAVPITLEAVVLVLLALSSTIMTIYAAIALGHLFKKYKLLASFGMYIVLKTIPQVLLIPFAATWGSMSIRFSSSLSDILQANTVLLLSILYTGAITAGYFILTNYILKRKLNLE